MNSTQNTHLVFFDDSSTYDEMKLSKKQLSEILEEMLPTYTEKSDSDSHIYLIQSRGEFEAFVNDVWANILKLQV